MVMENKMSHLFIVISCALFLTVSWFGDAWGREYRILLISSELGEPYQSVTQAMLAELSSAGYVQEKNLWIRSYSLDHFQGRAKNILRQEKNTVYDLICVFGTVGTIALKELILDDPQYPKVVFSTVTDPVGIGVIDDFVSGPKHNFTGVSYPVPVDKRLDFVRALMPGAKKIGLIYADMPQSHSYNKWLSELVENNAEYQGYTIFFRKVAFVLSQGGKIRMAQEAVHHIKELDPLVDLFLSPNDQLALQPIFPQTVYRLATKPLLGVGKADVMERRGATAAIYPSPESLGRQTAAILIRLLEGATIKSLVPEEAREFSMAFDMEKIHRFNIHIPPEFKLKAGVNIVGD